MSADQLNSSNDYGMLQSVNTLNEARKAELANNPNLAKQYYNKIGTYLSTLSANLNSSDVQQYVDNLNAYATEYAADRNYQSALATAAASKYKGLASAASTNASYAASSANNNVNNFEQLYNYYLTSSGGNKNYATNAFVNNLKMSAGQSTK